MALYGKRTYVDVTKKRILGQGDYPALSRWAQCNHRGCYERTEVDRTTSLQKLEKTGNTFSLDLQEAHSPDDFSPVKLTTAFGHPELLGNKSTLC